MNEPAAEGLTLSFLRSRPQTAAEVLGELEHEATARFLASIPARIAAPAFALMHPDDAAAALGHMDPARGAALIRAVQYADAITVLRLLPSTARERLYEELPGRLAEEVRRSLLYPLDVVGAWMDPSVPAFQAADTVAEVMRYLRRHVQAHLDHVFVVDEAQRLQGTVTLGAVLGAEPATTLEVLATPGLSSLSNRARLVVAADHPAWDEYGVLPVAGRKGNLLGGLPRAQLRRGLNALADEQRPASGSLESTGARLLGALLVSAAGLVRAVYAGPERHD